MHFFAKIFGHVKKKQYFCTLFRRKSIDESALEASSCTIDCTRSCLYSSVGRALDL